MDHEQALLRAPVVTNGTPDLVAVVAARSRAGEIIYCETAIVAWRISGNLAAPVFVDDVATTGEFVAIYDRRTARWWIPAVEWGEGLDSCHEALARNLSILSKGNRA